MKFKLFENKNIFIFVLFIFYCLCSLNSIGFYNDDEHFQILEPVAFLLGLNNELFESINYWEWKSYNRVRPWLQPYLYYNIILFLKTIHINDPFAWSLIIRFLNALLGFLSIVLLFFSVNKYFITKEKNYNYIIIFTFWFYPFLHVRTSSENLGIVLFTFAFAFLLSIFTDQKIKYNFFLIIIFGFFLGLSIVVRPQMIFTIIPIFLWVIFFKKDITKILLVIFGTFIAISFGLYVDYFHWGFFSNTYWQIFKVQILNGIMSDFGSEPWWFYFKSIGIEFTPVYGLVFLLSMFIFWIKNFKSIFSWLTFFTIFSFMFFEHKEIRFIFPIFIFAPFFLIYFFEKIKNKFFKNALLSICLLFNFILLIIVCFFFFFSKVSLYNNLYFSNYNIDKLYYYEENPYLINEMEPFFYTSFIPKIFEYNSKKSNEESWVTTNNYSFVSNIILKNNCEIKYSTYPYSLINLNKNWRNKKLNWYLVYCKKIN